MPPRKKKTAAKVTKTPGKVGRPRKVADTARLLSIRLPGNIRDRIEALAAAEDKTLTNIIVDVLQQRLGTVDVYGRLDDIDARLGALERRPQQLTFTFADEAIQAQFVSMGLAAQAPLDEPADIDAAETGEPDDAPEPEPEPQDSMPPTNGAEERPWANGQA